MEIKKRRSDRLLDLETQIILAQTDESLAIVSSVVGDRLDISDFAIAF